MRECGGCTLCCDLIEVPALNKPAGQQCAHCTRGVGCQIYDDRPQQCQGFDCLWLTNDLPDDLWPERCGVFFEPFWGERMIVAMVQPDQPDAWQADAPGGLIQKMIEDGFVVWVMAGVDRHLLLPDGVTEADGRERAKRAWERKWQSRVTQPI